MQIRFLLVGVCSFVFNYAVSQAPTTTHGTIQHFENFKSAWIPPRHVDVWLPPGYSSQKKYAVLYMHDGKGLFDSTLAKGKGEWQVDEIMAKLQAEKKVKDCIVVGIWNIESRRLSEYFPQKAFELLTASQQADIMKLESGKDKPLFSDRKVQSDNYLTFLVKELKPFIDSSFSTYRNSSNTFVAGSSMGGLISLYAICEYPDVFGGAACLSTHWPGLVSTVNGPIPVALMSYLKNHLPDPNNHKIYFDYGTKTLDAFYKPFQLQADTIMQLKGFTGASWMTKEFPGADHSKKSWSKRMDIPLVFLMGTGK
jgi:enterochelin esterase-like enzyme